MELLLEKRLLQDKKIPYFEGFFILPNLILRFFYASRSIFLFPIAKPQNQAFMENLRQNWKWQNLDCWDDRKFWQNHYKIFLYHQKIWKAKHDSSLKFFQSKRARIENFYPRFFQTKTRIIHFWKEHFQGLYEKVHKILLQKVLFWYFLS